MKKTIILLLFIGSICFGQESKSNYSFLKLYITNKNSEILLVKWGGEWEIPGKKYTDSESLTKTINHIADDLGIITYESLKLRGLFTFHYSHKPNPTIMQYYSIEYLEGEIRPLPSCSDVKWFSHKEAEEIISYEDMKIIISKIHKNPHLVYGGAFNKIKNSDNTTSIQVIEPIYTLNGCLN